MRYLVLPHAEQCWYWSHWRMMACFPRMPKFMVKDLFLFCTRKESSFYILFLSLFGTIIIFPSPFPWHRHNFCFLGLCTTTIFQRYPVTESCEVKGDVVWAKVIFLLIYVIPLQGSYICRFCIARVLLICEMLFQHSLSFNICTSIHGPGA